MRNSSDSRLTEYQLLETLPSKCEVRTNVWSSWKNSQECILGVDSQNTATSSVPPWRTSMVHATIIKEGTVSSSERRREFSLCSYLVLRLRLWGLSKLLQPKGFMTPLGYQWYHKLELLIGSIKNGVHFVLTSQNSKPERFALFVKF